MKKRQVTIRLSEEEWKAWHGYAGRWGESLSSFIRRSVDYRAGADLGGEVPSQVKVERDYKSKPVVRLRSQPLKAGPLTRSADVVDELQKSLAKGSYGQARGKKK